MWHEARKQERKIRVMMVDYQKRADRRRQYYEQIVSQFSCFTVSLFFEMQIICNKISCVEEKKMMYLLVFLQGLPFGKLWHSY
jgi:hypothetical protein